MSILTGTRAMRSGPGPREQNSSPVRSLAGPGRARLAQLGAVLAALAVWQLVRWSGFFSESVLPAPLGVARFLGEAVLTERYWAAVGHTLLGAGEGLAAALIVGVPLGLLTGTYGFAERSSRLITDLGRSYPVFALLPVLLLVLGATATMKAFCVFFACVFPIWLQAQYGARSLDPTVSETVRAYRIPGLLRFRRVVLPAALPSIMTGLRIGAATSVLVCVGVELLTSLAGMGAEIVDYQTANASTGAYGYIITCGAVGFGLTWLTEVAQNRLPARGPEAR